MKANDNGNDELAAYGCTRDFSGGVCDLDDGAVESSTGCANRRCAFFTAWYRAMA